MPTTGLEKMSIFTHRTNPDMKKSPTITLGRVESIDILRALTMVLMIFVKNELESKGMSLINTGGVCLFSNEP